MRDLTIVIPATIPALAGAGLLTRQDTISNVDIESAANNHGNGITFVGGGTYEDSAMYGVGGGSLQRGVNPNGVVAGPLELRRLQLSQVVSGVIADVAAVPITLRRSRIDAPTQLGVGSAAGATVTVENTVITDPGVTGIGATSNTAAGATAVVRHTTIVRVAGLTNVNPISAQVLNMAGFGDASLTATGMIIRGFQQSYFRGAPVDMGIGDANLTLAYSNFLNTGTGSGDGTLALGPGNIDSDPLFTGATDFHLLAGSPSIETADPSPATPVAEDFDGALRPADANGDCTARADMGAYEYQPPGPPPAACLPPPPSGTTPTSAPAKCKKKKKRGGKRAIPAKKRKKCKRKKR